MPKSWKTNSASGARTRYLGGLGGLSGMCAILLALFSLAATTVVHAQGAVRDIRVEGNRRVEPETVRSYLAFSPGDSYDPAKVDQSLKALFATGLFSDVNISSGGGGVVVVNVVENPVINRVAFEGNRLVEKTALETEVQLKSRSVYTRAKVQADVQRVLDVYRRQGLFAATVEPKVIELPQNRVDLVFEISEGKATKVKSINFSGNRSFTDSQLRDILTTNESGWLDFFKSNVVYDPDRLNLDRELLRQYYLKNGYADARVVAAAVDIDRQGQGFYITFTIDEGPVYRFGAIRVESAVASVDAGGLNGELLTKQGDLYNASLIDKTIEKLTLSVAEKGYAFARIRPKVDRDPAANLIGIAYIIEEGPRIYIERINVNGNTRTRDYVIRREFRLVEGDAYNPLLVDRAKKRIQALGFFKNVEVRRNAGSSPDRVVLDVDIVEQSTGELSFGAGYSSAEGVIGDVSITERNLLGRGQFLRLKLAGSAERQQIDLSFTEPRFLDRNLAAGFDLFHKETDYTSTSSFRSRKSGASTRLGFPLSESLWLTTNYSLVRDEIEIATNGTSIPSLAVREAAGKFNSGGSTTENPAWTSSVGYSLTYDGRNHPKNPNRGVYFSVGQELAGVGGDVKYIRTIAEGRGYYPITEKITFVGRLIGGNIAGWGGDDVRLLDMFYKGGETIRGFRRSGIGPRDIGSDNRDALGGKNFYAGTAEVRFPLPLIPDELGMSGAVFADAGSVFGASAFAKKVNNTVDPLTGKTFKLAGDDASLRASAGISLLWNSPLGPLRADYAFPLSRLKDDKGNAIDQVERFRFGASTKF
jgi:outer membrane protein insertion porin family